MVWGHRGPEVLVRHGLLLLGECCDSKGCGQQGVYEGQISHFGEWVVVKELLACDDEHLYANSEATLVVRHVIEFSVGWEFTIMSRRLNTARISFKYVIQPPFLPRRRQVVFSYGRIISFPLSQCFRYPIKRKCEPSSDSPN